ncbi:siderophore-interacting protein [Microbacterium sp. AG1240]|uniref:SIP domain-containing protein n=1 Tax=Microbacterium sp. AG1240 TaxID=2183992 RepID=UPI000EAE0C1F|nr:SIP domain-containing protein [Microbacterium sp. AG1240]RKT36418.1 siderophore-interacting protein [Microbacterium sp. AG1240]
MGTQNEHNETVCRSSRHTRVQHLITADESSLVDLETLLVTLPICSTGRVFIEVPDASWIGPLRAPARMTVTWLDRSRRAGAPGTARSCAPGEALTRAVTGWAGEMLCDAESAAHTRVFLLGGYLGTADIVDELTLAYAVDAASIHTPERFGLATAR